MKVIYLVRHGQASFGEKDYDQLSPLGFEQSELLARHLKGMDYPIDTFLSGTLNRHQQSAQATLAQFETVLDNDEQWNEFNHQEIFNVARKKHSHWADNAHHNSTAEMLQRFSIAINEWINPDNAGLYSESWSQFSTRAQRALAAAINRIEKVGVVFTSGGVISTIVGRQWQLSTLQTMQLNWTLVNTGITKLLISKTGVQVSSVNVHSHLDCKQHKNKITYK